MVIRRFFVWSLISLISGFGGSNGISFGQKCPSSDTESILQVSNVYTYHYRSEALAQAVGTTEDHGKIAMECDVQVTPIRDCLYTMDLQDCKVTATGGESGSQTAWIDHQTLPDLSKHSVAFSLSNGEIGEVKIHDEDPLYYVNIKRGVLSAFVFKLSQTEKELQENHTDIHGTCPLTSVPADGRVKTSKDMLNCKFPSRPDWQLSPWSIFWNMSFIQHVINSTTDCEYEINRGERRIQKVSCKERHAIMLESTHRTTTAVQTNVFYHLDFLNSRVKTADPTFPDLTRTTDIRYEYEHTPVPQSSPQNFLPVAKKMLSDLVLDSLDEIRLFTIPQFTEFVGWIRSSHNLSPLVDSVKDCTFLPNGMQCDQKIKDLAYSYMSDALLQCNNIPCVKALTYLALNDDLSPTYLNFIFHSWSYMHYSKPGFITNFVEICRIKNSHQCWLSLGSFIHRMYSRNEHMDEQILQEVRDVSSFFYNSIREECEVTEERDTNRLYTNCLIFLKAASNLGKHYTEIVPDAVNQFIEVATDEYALVVVRTSALEALKDVCNPTNQDQQHLIYDRLLPLLQNVSLPASVRILSYDLLVLESEDYNFEEHLIKILKEDINPEVKYYIADSLISLIADHEFRSKRRKFVNSLDELLRSNSLSLEVIVYKTKGKSKATSQDVFLKLSSLPDYMKRFGLKIRDSFIYDSYIYPTVVNQKTILQLFSTFLPTMELSTYFEGWEEIILAYKKNLADMNTDTVSFSKIVEAVMKTVEEYGKINEDSLRNFDENILSNVKKLHHLYWEHHKKLNPYAKTYMDLFGSTVKYHIQDRLQSSGNDGIGKLLHSIGENLANGVVYNTTRVVRVIEAYHQVPTLMGLPLNWTTNATLAFSIRAGLKYQMNSEDNHIHAKGFLQPSAALTFLNRMVLDFPTLTQIGVQANSSGYSSTELRAQFSSTKGRQKLRIDRPSKTQKILELFRTNQLIKHDRYEDIPDWDIERTASSWCTKQNSASGLKACLSKSYPNVTHRIKPWALMAGWCKWQFLVLPTSSNDVHYEIELQQESKQKLKEINVKLSASGKEKEKAALFKAVIDESGKDLKLDLRTTVMPDFIASLTRSESKSKKVSGHKIEAVLKLLKDFKYELEYSNEDKIQKSSTKTSLPPAENSQIIVNEMHFNFKTPYSTYVWNKTLFTLGENVKSERSLSYENTNAKVDWMKNILPPAFWEDDKKASMKLRLHWKKPIYKTQDTFRQTEFRLEVPRYIMTLNAEGLQSSAREQVVVNLVKKDIKQGKLDTFLNFTYDYWANENTEQYDKVIRLVNITIPRRSWSARYEKNREGSVYRQEVSLKQCFMKPVNDVKSNYIGWWTNEMSDSFKLEEREIKLVANTDFVDNHMDADELADKYSTVTSQDLEGLKNELVVSDVVLHYPFYDKIETVSFDGYFIFSKDGWRVFRFQKNFDMISTYNNLKLTSHSVYRHDEEAAVLYHTSYFTHLPSDTKAHNTIHFVWKDSRGGNCHDIEFQHDIRSHAFDLLTDATYRCETEADKLHTLRLKINTNSSMWNMLDIKLDQIMEDVSPAFSREEMNTIHATGTIHVDAEWQTLLKQSQKRVILCSKDGNCPNAELSIENWPLRKSVKFNRNDYEISYNRKFSPDYKTLHINVGYGHKVDGESEVLDINGELIAPNYNVWKGTLNTTAYNKVKEIFTAGYEKFQNAFAEIASDKDHPLNEILRPALKMTLYDYWKSLKTEFKESISVSWAEAKEIFYSLDAFIQPAYEVFINSASAVNGVCREAYNSLKEKSVTIWAINYFQLPYYFQEGISGLPQALNELWNQVALGEENVLHFKFVTGKILALTSFMKLPSLSFNPGELANVFAYKTKVKPSDEYGDGKIAMLFGPLHVYTFDGHLYDVPEYPHSDCTYLLAHDVHKSLFTVFSSQKGINILFPEMSITINDKNEVFVNGSHQPTALPIQASNGKVTVKRGNVVQVWSPSLSVTCRSQDFLCILKLSDFHIGGIIGLLGNADKYPENDFMLPNGSTSEMLEFVRSYEISGKSECRNLALTAVAPPTETEKEMCEQKFGRVCYYQYDIFSKFLKACIADIKAGHGACYTTAGLSALCSLKHSPSHTECNVKQQETTNIGRNLEVVLVVQESKYLTSPDKANSPVKGIESLIKAVDDRFKEAGYVSIKYSLVGFGGNGVHFKPTIHSSEKDIWLPADAMINDVLKTLEFKSREGTDSIQALRYALKELGHDSFGSKVFIVITAKDKQVADKSLLDFIQNDLEENGITLYTLSYYPSIEKGKKVFGVRADGLIFPSQTKDGGEAYLDYPRGNLAKLTSSTRGSVFLIKFLQDNKPPAFFTEFAQEVWAKVNREAQKCRSCKFVGRSGWWYKNECNIVSC